MIRYRTEEQLAEAIERGTKSKFFVGCDLGQAQDYSAISVVERKDVPCLDINKGWPTGKTKYATTFDVRHLDRLPLGTTYPSVVRHLQTMMATAPLKGNAELVVDRTGVGRGIFDLLKEAKLEPVGITITGGRTSSQKGSVHEFWVSKIELVSFLVAAHHQGVLRVSNKLKHGDTLEQEFENFQLNFTAAGNATFSAREGLHDDLILALAISVWYARYRDGRRFGVSNLMGW